MTRSAEVTPLSFPPWARTGAAKSYWQWHFRDIFIIHDASPFEHVFQNFEISAKDTQTTDRFQCHLLSAMLGTSILAPNINSIEGYVFIVPLKKSNIALTDELVP